MRVLSEEIRKEIIDHHNKGKDFKTTSKQLDVPVMTMQVLFGSLRSD